MKEADELVEEVLGALKERVNGAMTLDDREAYSLARELVEPHGYTVLQAVKEWEKTKAPYRGKKTGDKSPYPDQRVYVNSGALRIQRIRHVSVTFDAQCLKERLAAVVRSTKSRSIAAIRDFRIAQLHE